MSVLDGGLRTPTPSRNRPHGNLAALRIAVVVLFGILTAQLVRMQIIDGSDYAQRSRENHLTRREILPARGLIFDRKGVPLVENAPIYTATITPLFLPEEPEKRYAIYLALEGLTGVPALEIQARVHKGEVELERPDIEISLQKYLTKEQALKLEEASVDMPGVALAVKPGRRYIGGDAFSHLLGYVGDQNEAEYAELRKEGYSLNEQVGKTGVEARYETVLRGVKGATAAEQDAQGNLVKALKTQDPVPGSNLRLSIDSELQNFIADLLDASLGDAQHAAAVVMNAKTGEIYAMVSLPSYDNNIFAEVDKRQAEWEQLQMYDPRRPLNNQALTASAPGSVFKLITASAGLQEKSITPETSLNVASKALELKDENGEAFYLYDWAAHGMVDLRRAIAVSSNQYFFMVSCGILGQIHGLGKDVDTSAIILGHYARAFGLGQPTGLDIGGDESGVIPSPQWKERAFAENGYPPEQGDWFYGDTCNMGIGQGFDTATPLQIARMTAAVANGGKLLTPHVGKDVLDNDGKVISSIQPEWTKVPVDPANLQIVREGMLQSVNSGAGARAAVAGISIAGKTGTAEFGPIKENGKRDEHAWFTGFTPYDDPEVVVTVYFDLGVGGDKAAPVAGTIFAWMAKNFTP